MKKRYWLLMCFLLILILISALHLPSSETKKGYAMFSWKNDIMEADQKEVWLSCLKEANVTQLYQQFSSEELQKTQTKRFIRDIMQEGVTVYALDGDASWAYEEQYHHIEALIHDVIAYNESVEEADQLQGIVFDIEPYLCEEWKAGKQERKRLMEQYVSNMIEAYTYAKAHDLEMLVCIPTFFDVTNQDILEQLIASGCDGIAIMNYNRSDEAGQIETEVELARSHQKKVINIYELQEPKRHDLEEINTYANVGLPALWQSAEALAEQFDYDELSFAYHYYEPLLELLAKGEMEHE